jgi:plastocyanin domain-containing protein
MRMAALLTLLVALPALAADKAPATPAAGKTIEIKVTDAGFVPKEIRVKKGVPVTLSFLRTTDRTCIKAVDIPDEKVKNFQLPLDKAVSLTITPAKVGVEPFHCTAMAMGGGKIIVE